MPRKTKPFPRPYVYHSETPYKVGGETRISSRWVAAIRTAIDEPPLYLARRDTEDEALQACRDYLETGVKPAKQISACICTRKTASGARYDVKAYVDGKNVHIGTGQTRAESEGIKQRFEATGHIPAKQYAPRGTRKPRVRRKCGPRAPRMQAIRSPHR